ncbi:MAG: class I adenylate-forming enzyme family protein [Alphaproteobacteria bacterium]
MALSGQSWFGSGIADAAAARPRAAAIIRDDGEVSFGDFYRTVERFAAALWARGVRPGQAPGLPPGAGTVALAHNTACQRPGVAVLGLAPHDPAAVARALIASAGAPAVIAGGAAMPADWQVPTWSIGSEWQDADPTGLPPPPANDAPCYLTRSSGTTGGLPKLTTTSHGQEAADVDHGWWSFPLDEGDRYLSVIAFHFGFGRTGAQRALMRGGAVVLPPPLRSMAGLLSSVAAHRPTWTLLTPTHLRELMAVAPPSGRLLDGMRIVFGSAPLSGAELRRVTTLISGEVYPQYGANETGCLTIATPDDVRRNPDAVGRPNPETQMQVVDIEDAPCPPGIVGTVRFRNPRFPQGYHRADPDATSRFVGGWFYPGDAGMIDEDGLLVLKGRVDDLINVGGQKVYPTDIEGRLAQHPDVVEAAAFGIDDPVRGSAVAAAVVLRSPVAIADLIEHCRLTLGLARSPRRIVAVPALPRNEIGKIDRVALRRHIGGRVADDAGQE